MSTNRFMTFAGGVRRLVTAISSSAGAADANKVVATDSAGKLDLSLMPPQPYLLFADLRSAGTESGASANGAWITRPLNSEVADTHNLGSLSANQITLAAGTYRFRGKGALYLPDRAQHRLYNVTAAAAVAGQISESHLSFSGNNVVVYPECKGRFTLASSATLELQYRCETAIVIYGLGVASGWGEECYATLEFWRES